MKLFRQVVFAVSLLFALQLFFACTKNGGLGLTGPQGPQGDTGTTGPQGPQGATGTANVIYSQWFDPSSYTKDTVYGTYGFYYNKATTDITQQVVDSGVVITFGKLDGYQPSIWPTDQVAELPINITYMSASVANIDNWSALITAGNLKIQLTSSTNAYGIISNLHKFRYVIIPGGIASSVASIKPGLAHGNVFDDTTNPSIEKVRQNYREMGYAEICKRLGIPQ